jgi:SAM-dependent methyltransferase
MQTTAQTGPIYWLGHTDTETQRLIRQAGYYNAFTRQLFAEAGIAPGMRVLDIGSGAGDVAFLAAEFVGPTGQVVGVDQNPAVLAVARERARTAGLTHVEFVAGDARDLAAGERFDAVVGRLVLMYLSDPAAALRAFTRHLKPGGIVAFQDYTIRLTWPHDSALWGRVAGWIQAAGQCAGVEMAMGDKLRPAFLAAGLPEPQLRLAARIGGGPDFNGYAEVAAVVRSLLPLILRFGIATAPEVDIETLEDRLRVAAVAANGIVKMPDLVSAWARVPALATRGVAVERSQQPAPLPGAPAASAPPHFARSALLHTDVSDLLGITLVAV